MTTVQELAQEVAGAFEHVYRDEKMQRDGYWRLKNGSPQWMSDLAMAAHGDMMPDDWRYDFIWQSVAALAEMEDDDDENDALDTIEASIYTNDLTGWLHSRTDRYAYCDEAWGEFGKDSFDSLTTLLAAGQLQEIHEVFWLVYQGLRERSESIDDSEDAEEDDA